jgi:hypothetical protein
MNARQPSRYAGQSRTSAPVRQGHFDTNRAFFGGEQTEKLLARPSARCSASAAKQRHGFFFDFVAFIIVFFLFG